ncbi:hypothetical protein CRG98_043680 [Punica granatum]|uniref:Uncharacterized protein n=1 Tax=Punica granatum TaxID=22663 RepID=A0A2I0HXE5_PUNGR|nr:hypothetical protein CRG98_043680 [Punica granatum]
MGEGWWFPHPCPRSDAFNSSFQLQIHLYSSVIHCCSTFFDALSPTAGSLLVTPPPPSAPPPPPSPSGTPPPTQSMPPSSSFVLRPLYAAGLSASISSPSTALDLLPSHWSSSSPDSAIKTASLSFF